MAKDTALAERPEQPQVSLGTLQAVDASHLVAGATDIANQLASVIKSRSLSVRIGPKDYVRVEGWSTLCALLGVMPQEISNTPTEDGSYIAIVELIRMVDGVVISRASAECGMDEKRWAGMPRYARRSMAATRATGKAARLAFGWVMALSGYESTPLEEMDCVRDAQQPRPAIPFDSPAPQQNAAPEADKGVWEGRLAGIEEATGINQKTGKPWTKWAMHGKDSPKFSTFDTKLKETAEALVDELVCMEWEKKGKFYNLTAIYPNILETDSDE